jgi:hypothetical protein
MIYCLATKCTSCVLFAACRRLDNLPPKCYSFVGKHAVVKTELSLWPCHRLLLLGALCSSCKQQLIGDGVCAIEIERLSGARIRGGL